jgi:ADP-heptose:LPS heptosyltransferase
MGMGDHLISTAMAKKAYARIGEPVVIGDGSRVEWSPVFANNPKIAKEAFEGCLWVRSYKGARPYIESNEPDKLIYKKDFRAEPGEIFFSDEEMKFFADFKNFVLIEPNVKRLPLSKNKDWGHEKWQKVVNALPHIQFVQMKTGKYKLENVKLVDSPGIRHGFAMVRQCDLFVGTDGALHHAAAALGKPAVVVWGGLASPVNLGYSTHVNLHAGSKPCGSKFPCLHCQYELEKITVEMVIEAIKKEHGRITGSENSKSVPAGVGERGCIAETA